MRITVYLTGGIACYKAVQLVTELEKRGHQVRAVMTKNAERFVAATTLAALTKYAVLDDLWAKENKAAVPHVHLARWTDLAIIIPATANFIAKMALGIADDAASTTLLATAACKLVVPAMNDQMWQSPATQRNLLLLRKDGVKVMEPATGMLAEGYSAKGRMPEIPDVLTWIDAELNDTKYLQGKKIIVTAGGTAEPIDPVRFIGNRSSGKMGIAIAEVAANCGAQVTLIYANVTAALPDNSSVKLIHTATAREMLQAVEETFPGSDALIMAAAVADWQAKNVAASKLKKTRQQDTLNLSLVKTPDILQTMAHKKKDGQVVVGFAAETNDLLDNAEKKLAEKGADYIVANDVSQNVFGSEQDQVVIINKKGELDMLPRMSKKEIAADLLEIVANRLG
ncbi:bifunctional phosphopantothenoylcysteine decarboxylase/phosphopantothenate--cysteine ligase CoaBC [Lactobacillus sp. ESL0791]|uniref:bifunctional phosphopantothenoylcysteine decarboxylase/phosphopantothenate--cysteine ligase CoaBC n=1 Tax=Lactobacillus sp. ESL0791 TaxID=2983234 RepID=UPI0023F6ACF5|nr:bifunctional phosphopantothenoylcysteine decarboxylase/phosphopantothenate--cysteine ligase CoaBC [Lactobacillus sp. ESL0791]MDF7638852.1 bifunctional phosphopantothenoylcysteine decarboxylase/phosphopantothenate--cysteine ligase CoaBC [Lactobacillus sp. ESL0791]